MKFVNQQEDFLGWELNETTCLVLCSICCYLITVHFYFVVAFMFSPSPVSCAKCFSSLYPTTRRQLSTPMGGRALHLISFVHSLCIEKETYSLNIKIQTEIQIKNTK